MRKQNEHSDEYISAYIDGELDSEERARLLFDEQSDEELTQRINQARMLKEKIQLTYADIKNTKYQKKTFSCSAFISRHRTLVAAMLLITITAAVITYNTADKNLILAKQLINNTQPIAASTISRVIGDNRRVIISLSQYHPHNFNDTLNNIEALLQSDAGTDFRLEIVANGKGLKALDSTSSLHAEKITLLAERFDNLEIVACAKSMAMLAAEGDPIQLMKSIMMTPSVVQQVAKRTSAGWLYLKI